MRAGMLLLLAVGWLAQGCAVTTELVREQAVHDLQCPEDRLAIESIGRGRYQASGCHLRADYRCATNSLGRTQCLRGNTNTFEPEQHVPRIRHKAASLLGCDPAALEVKPSGGHHKYTASGCGKRVEYECAARDDCCAFTAPGVQPLAGETAPTAETPLAAAPEAGTAKGSLPKSGIKAVIETNVGDVRSCYERALTKPPWIAGLVEIKFVIEPDGKVGRATVSRSSLEHAEVESCIVDAMRSWKFAAPEGGGIVVVTYPFVLQTNNGPFLLCR